MTATSVKSSEIRCEKCFLERRESWLFVTMLMAFSGLWFYLWGPFDVYMDALAYIDPAASYIMGKGFTSGCWYFQAPNEFWAGNVSLYQILLILWLKLFGFSSDSVLTLNISYISLAIVLLWRAMMSSGVIPLASWRLAAIVFFLATRTCLQLVTFRRPEALCFLILKRPSWRWIGFAGCGFLAVWAGLSLAVVFAFAGLGAILFYGREYFRDVVALAVGGVVGFKAVICFYHKIGVLDVFLMNISLTSGFFETQIFSLVKN